MNHDMQYAPSEREIELGVDGYRDWLRQQEIKRSSHEAAHRLGVCRCGTKLRIEPTDEEIAEGHADAEEAWQEMMRQREEC